MNYYFLSLLITIDITLILILVLAYQNFDKLVKFWQNRQL